MSQPHFPLTAWADFNHGILVGQQMVVMKQHLDSSCNRCQSDAHWMRSLGQFLRSEPANTPPAGLTHFAVGSYAWARPRRQQSRAKLTLATLLGGLSPLAAGLRAGPGQTYHAAYRAGGWVVDVRLEPVADRASAGASAGRHLLSGQIIHAADPLRRIPDAPVSVRTDSQVLAVTATNDHGEFQCELASAPSPESHLEIHLIGTNNQRVYNGATEETVIVPLRILRGEFVSPAGQNFLGDAQ